MTLYLLVLFVHITAVLGMFAALCFEGLSLLHLRRISTLAEARRWSEPVPGLPMIAVGSLLVILLSGVYLTVRLSAFGMAWPKVTIGAFLLMAPLGALSARRGRTVRQANAEARAFNSELSQRLQDPILKISLGIRFAVFLGILLLMVAKPELWESLTILGIAVTVGFLSSLVVWGGDGRLSTPNTGPKT